MILARLFACTFLAFMAFAVPRQTWAESVEECLKRVDAEYQPQIDTALAKVHRLQNEYDDRVRAHDKRVQELRDAEDNYQKVKAQMQAYIQQLLAALAVEQQAIRDKWASRNGGTDRMNQELQDAAAKCQKKIDKANDKIHNADVAVNKAAQREQDAEDAVEAAHDKLTTAEDDLAKLQAAYEQARAQCQGHAHD